MCSSMADGREEDAHSNDDENGIESDEDLESLRKACALTGADFNSLNGAAYNGEFRGADGDDLFVDSESEDDMELVRSIQKRFSSAGWTLQPVLNDDDNDDDFQTLCAVKRRFAAFDDNDYMRDKMGSVVKSKEQVDVLSMEQSGNLSMGTTDESCKNSEEVAGAVASVNDGSTEFQPSSFPKFAQAFLDAIKRNRSCQKLLRSKMSQIGLKMEENKKMMGRVKVLKDLQLQCKKLTGQALALRKDPRIQLISSRKALASSNGSKVNEKIGYAAHTGPMENTHVANYRAALKNFPLSLNRKKWTEAEKNKLEKGLRQQIQQIMFQCAVDHCNEGSYGDTNILDNVLGSIRDFIITPEKIREFLPKVDWDKLASMLSMGRSGAECEQQWLNFEDPLINHGPWTSEEDKTLLFIVQEKGVTNWFDIAISLGTKRTPSQCLARFQRSLNARILKREWTEEEDAQLRSAVETFGERDWQSVASVLGGRTGTQCSNRWKKTLHPDRKIVGRWRADEDKRLKVAVKLFGPKNWNKIANFVPGRTHVQCRERWTNSLDPSLNRNKWTEEEDSKLLAAVEEYGHCWSKVASHVPGRTDNLCWRRWKVLVPHEVPLLQAARKLQKAALIGNFVDRESERPRLGPNDFVASKMIECASGSENADQPTKNKRRRGCNSNGENCSEPDNRLEKLKPKRRRKGLKDSSEVSLGTTAELITTGNSEAMTTRS